MTKKDLESGMVVEMSDGELCLYTEDKRFYTLDDGSWHCELNDYRDDLTTDAKDYDIVKVYADYHMTDVLWERVEQPSKEEQPSKKYKLKQLLNEILEEL